MEDVKCPYCEHEQEINHDDGYGYEENEIHQQQCSNCEKTFTYTTSIIFYYEADKADCLNDGEHHYEPENCSFKYMAKMVCNTCGEKRDPTTEERKKYGLLPTEDDLRVFPHLNKFLK